MGLEWALLVLPVALFVWLGAGIWGRRLQRADVTSTAAKLRDARSVTSQTDTPWSGRHVWYAIACVLGVVLTLGAFGGVVRGFAVDPSESVDQTGIFFAAFCVFGTVAALLIWPFRAAVIVPTRIRRVTGETNGIVFASGITPSVRKFFGNELSRRTREIYLSVEEGVSFWIDRGSTMVEIGRLSKSQIIDVRPFGLPRSAGVDEVVMQSRSTDGKVSSLHVKPFTRAFDQSRAFERFLSSCNP